ncbi:MAG TPA: hypothetical protein VGN48_03145 [Pedococcus sp.]|nr:hypothetical protein [Pedococcus sp.]
MSEEGLPSGRPMPATPRVRRATKAGKAMAASARHPSSAPEFVEGTGDRVITRTVERIETPPRAKRSKADTEKIVKAANALIEDLRSKRDSLPHGI